MAATGNTTNFNLPLYNAGDDVSYLGTFNDAMTKIDTEMETLTVAETANNESITNLTNRVEKVEEEIPILQQGITSATGAVNGLTSQVSQLLNLKTYHSNRWDMVSGLNKCEVEMTDNWLVLKAGSNIPWGSLPTVTAVGYTYKYFAKINNANITNAPSPRAIALFNGLYRYLGSATPSEIHWGTPNLIYDGLNTYLGFSPDFIPSANTTNIEIITPCFRVANFSTAYHTTQN